MNVTMQTVKVNPTKKLSEYDLPTVKLFAIKTWWTIQWENRRLPYIVKGEHKGWLPAVQIRDTEKAVLLAIDHYGETTERWIPKSIILATTNATLEEQTQ